MLISVPSSAQKAEISSVFNTHDFGLIPESEEGATYAFAIKNTGSEDLVISKVTASCGCARPEWPKNPIPPGQGAEIKVSYISTGRPGPFHKSITINSNAANSRFTLYIKGSVTERQALQTAIVYPYSAGELMLETKTVTYNRIYPGEKASEAIRVKNGGTGRLTVSATGNPDYLTVECNPKTLNAGETGEISIVLNADVARRLGRIPSSFSLKVESAEAKRDEIRIPVRANVIENLAKLSALEKAKAPAAQYSQTHLDFGRLPEKSGGIIPFIGSGRESETLKITNSGRSALHIYSISSDSETVEISGGKREIKPGSSADYRISIRTKDIKAHFEDYIYIVTNDPGGQVKIIKVTAEK